MSTHWIKESWPEELKRDAVGFSEGMDRLKKAQSDSAIILNLEEVEWLLQPDPVRDIVREIGYSAKSVGRMLQLLAKHVAILAELHRCKLLSLSQGIIRAIEGQHGMSYGLFARAFFEQAMWAVIDVDAIWAIKPQNSRSGQLPGLINANRMVISRLLRSRLDWPQYFGPHSVHPALARLLEAAKMVASVKMPGKERDWVLLAEEILARDDHRYSSLPLTRGGLARGFGFFCDMVHPNVGVMIATGCVGDDALYLGFAPDSVPASCAPAAEHLFGLTSGYTRQAMIAGASAVLNCRTAADTIFANGEQFTRGSAE